MLRRFGWFRDLPFTVLSDPSRRLYGAFGLRTRPLLRLFDRETIMSYTRAFVRGHLPRLRRTDLRQLGGDVVLNRAGNAVFVYRSETPADRPPVEVLLRTLREAGQSSRGGSWAYPDIPRPSARTIASGSGMGAPTTGRCPYRGMGAALSRRDGQCLSGTLTACSIYCGTGGRNGGHLPAEGTLR
jgi:hypothetical protein